MRFDQRPSLLDTVGIEAKVAFLSDPNAYPARPRQLTCRETHMSWVFIGDRFVYKLKKPVRFSYLDFSTLERREASCRAELRLNRRLAPDVYVTVAPLTLGKGGLAIGGAGRVVDFLVVMRRLDERKMLENAVLDGWLERATLDRLAEILASFYARAHPSLTGPGSFLADWRRKLAENRRVLADTRLGLDFAACTRINRALRRFISECPCLLTERIVQRRIVHGHGDLRPEHIWLGEPIAIIDCLEFSPALRAVDPFDELAFLEIECERLGTAWPGAYLAKRIGHLLGDWIAEPLRAYYRCYRAATRARLAFAHLLEPDLRESDKWPKQGRAYLRIASQNARTIENFLAEARDRQVSGEGTR
jgi:aminoglycoside phosphotransferase family enzyme